MVIYNEMRSERVDARCYLIGANAAQKKKKEIMWVLDIHENGFIAHDINHLFII